MSRGPYKTTPEQRAAIRKRKERRRQLGLVSGKPGERTDLILEHWHERDHEAAKRRARCNLYKPESWDLQS